MIRSTQNLASPHVIGISAYLFAHTGSPLHSPPPPFRSPYLTFSKYVSTYLTNSKAIREWLEIHRMAYTKWYNRYLFKLLLPEYIVFVFNRCLFGSTNGLGALSELSEKSIYMSWNRSA